MSKIVMMVGLPASGKSTTVRAYTDFYCLNRDSAGGTLNSLLPIMRQMLQDEQNIILDNLNATTITRKPFLNLAKEFKIPVHCEWITTSVEDCQINSLMRMYFKYGQLFLHPDDIKNHPDAKKDPNIFPIGVIFHYKKIFEKPTMEEGFASIHKVSFQRVWPQTLKNKALFLDHDDTLRHVNSGKYHFPTKIEEVTILPNVKYILPEYVFKGYILVGISNQSGIARGEVTEAQVKACFYETNRQIGLPIDTVYCPHYVPPVCYCRKPQSGLAIQLIMKHLIDPTQSLMVGDKTSDCTMAQRLGIKYIDQKEFFNR